MIETLKQKINKLSKNKKLLTLVLVVVLFGLFLPIYTRAFSLKEAAAFLGNLSLSGAVTATGYSLDGQAAAWASVIAPIAAVFIPLMGMLMSAAIDISINLIGPFLESYGVLYIWKISRDLSNVVLVFILLYTAINLVIDRAVGGDPKKIISGVIVVAMLINFSGFIVRASVDVSNTIAYEFYKKVSNDNHYFAIGMNFVKNSQAGSGIWGLIVKPVKWVTGNSDPASYDPPSEPGRYAVRVVGQAIFFVVLFLVFLIIGLLFIFRTVAIIGLFIFSPFGILSYAIPNASKKIAGWTDSLMKQLFFAPIMMFLLYAVMKIAEQGNDILTAINQQIDKMDTSYFTDMAYIVALNTAGQLLYFAIIAGLLIKSISWAKDMGAIGVDFAKKYASGALGLAAAGGIAIGKYGGKKALETNTGKNIASKFNSKFNNWYGGTSKTARLTRMIDRTPVGEKVRAFAKNPILGTAGGVNKFSAGLLGDGNFVDEKMIEQMSKIAETSKKSYER